MYNQTLTDIIAREKILLNEKLAPNLFDAVLSQTLTLRKNYIVDLDGKYAEVSQFLSFLKTLIIKQEKNISNSTFTTLVNEMASLHEEFDDLKYQKVFRDRELEYFGEVENAMIENKHPMTTPRLKQIFRITKELSQEQPQSEL